MRMPPSHFLSIFHFFFGFVIRYLRHDFSKLERKQDGCKRYRQKVCYRFRHINRHCLINTENLRQNIDQWDQQDEFPHNRHQDRRFGFT